WGGTLPRDGASSIYAYVRLAEGGLRSRMFTRELYEDPATGSATATVAALLLDLSGEERLSLTVRQGVEMGRASLLRARAWREGGAIRAGVAGDCAKVMEGWLRG
ncbi:PhzF family phenazine biosynthesis protein, partial [Roseomonas mucosa]